MAGTDVPHFANDTGLDVIHVGAHEIMCVGASPPFDHPHVFLEMGREGEVLCPYCSTLYRFRETLKHGECDPPSARWRDAA